ncbi:CBS domain-containing protein [Evansella sp. AB-P1]|uniref:CBS domain-containing protein n=1 Tax=Evansella sp. AB-P1 TaxID=3037653 RepID=UPI00241D9EA2|nr:CBS domain-containing protein [Evansella sp. AB-P1]MDG5786499.1 CBS domain-containing protein [Evansella sp. AB-P1]
MKVITSHTNLDFDGLASMIGAKKLYPQAELILPDKVSSHVAYFLGIYKDIFPFKRQTSINWEHVNHIIVVDTNSYSRLGNLETSIKHLPITIFDHHPITSASIKETKGEISAVGATITIISEHIQRNGIIITPFEATVFALGLYSDTGSFTYEQTTSRDLLVGAWLLQCGANLSVVDQFREAPLSETERSLFLSLLDNSERIVIDSIDIVISTHIQSYYTGNLAYITRKILDVTSADAAFSIVKMGEKIFITSRASSERVNVLPIIKELEGGGHRNAASAMVRNDNETETTIKNFIKTMLPTIVSPAITAKHLMTSPVRVVAPKTTIEDVSKMLYRYGHTGFPVIEDGKLVGIISRRDVDKALHHGLGHAPVKGYMSREVDTIQINDSLEHIQEVMIEKQIGRLPVLENGHLIGIVSRTDVIQATHGNNSLHANPPAMAKPFKRKLEQEMKHLLPKTIVSLLRLIGNEASQLGMKAYLIGGMVRDILLNRINEDMDIVIEGDGIQLAQHLQDKYGGHIRSHENFKTATWKHASGLKIDITTARTEYYDFPAALPKVEISTIKEDLFRRDFTINAMGICLHSDEFSELIDYFHGYEHLIHRKIKVLYNLSFVEDPTRIFRAIRFENRFHFRMDKQTETLVKESANNILSVSKPRLANEISKLFLEENQLRTFKRMEQLGLLPFFLKNFDKESTIKLRMERLVHASNLLRKDKIELANSFWIVYLLCLTNLKDESWDELKEFSLRKEDQKLLDDIQSLWEQDVLQLVTRSDLGNWHSFFSTYELESLVAYFSVAPNEKYDDSLNYLLNREKMTPKVGGRDLKEYGIEPGPIYKELLLLGESIQLNNPNLTKDEIMNKILLFNNKEDIDDNDNHRE